MLWKLGCWCRWILQACDLVAAEWACSEGFPSRNSASGSEVGSPAEGAHLRGCLELPIELCAMHLKSHGRNVDPRIFESVHAGLENSNTDRWILREPRGDYEAGGSTTDDNVIILCHHLRRWSTGSHSEWPVSVFEALSANVYDSRWTLHSICWSISIMVRWWVGGNCGVTKGEITNNPSATSLLALQCCQHAQGMHAGQSYALQFHLRESGQGFSQGGRGGTEKMQGSK